MIYLEKIIIQPQLVSKGEYIHSRAPKEREKSYPIPTLRCALGGRHLGPAGQRRMYDA